jgi:hypothetical protein
MPKLTPQEAAQKWRDRLAGATEDVKAGIMRVTESPTAKAADSADKWFAGIQKAKSTGKFERGLRSVSLEEWKAKAAGVGADRIATGAAAAVDKVEGVYAKLFPFEERLQNDVKKMPNVTLEDSVNRSVAWIRGMSKFDRTK